MKRISAILLVCAATCSVLAEEKFLQLSLTPGIALQPRDAVIAGISLNIWGENEQRALTIGFVNGSTGESAGLSWGIVNYAERYTGLELGFVNYVSEEFTGVQLGGVNVAASHATGLQLGFVNYAASLQGVQLGFINVIEDNTWFENFPDKLAVVFPFVNWSF